MWSLVTIPLLVVGVAGLVYFAFAALPEDDR